MKLNKYLLTALVLLLGSFPALASPAPASETLLAEGRVDAAISSLQQTISTVPNDAHSYNLLCRAYLVLGNWDSGISACQKAVSLEPNNAWYHLWLGRVYGEKADHVGVFSAAGLAKKVRTEFETAVRLDPKNMDARSDLAEFYLEAPGIVGGGKDKAQQQAKELATIDPRESYLIQARIAEKDKDLGMAERNYQAAITASNGKPGPWLSLAEFYHRTGQLDKMQDAVNHAASAQNNNHILMSAAETLVHNKAYVPEAIRLLHRYLAGGTVEDAPAFKAHYLLGTLLEQQGDKAGAAQEYRAALSLAEKFSPARNALNRLEGQVAQNTNGQ